MSVVLACFFNYLFTLVVAVSESEGLALSSFCVLFLSFLTFLSLGEKLF